ncbi:MAG: glycoside hydrolase family 127 protein, partial [Phycisphaerae bacterium]|nr:glycoside hydrolase family 127 protein [Phycisphaerae bacterium]
MRKAVLFLLSVATAVLTGPWVPLSAAEVTVVSRPPSAGENPFYVGNREPLVPNPLLKLSIGAIEPEGWLGHQLMLARDGMVGQLAELSRWCKPDDNAWLSPTGAGKHGWEELPYWLRGYGDLGYVLGDEAIMAAARVWIDAVLGSQRDDGYFGPASNLTNVDGKPDLWPNMIMVNVLQSFHEATGDKRVVPFLLKYFRWQQRLPREQFLHASWQKIRAGDNLEKGYSCDSSSPYRLWCGPELTCLFRSLYG